MFGLISKKKLIEVAVDTYLKNYSNNDMTMEEFRFQCGVANGLNYLCYKFGVDLSKEVKKAKERIDRE